MPGCGDYVIHSAHIQTVIRVSSFHHLLHSCYVCSHNATCKLVLRYLLLFCLEELHSVTNAGAGLVGAGAMVALVEVKCRAYIETGEAMCGPSAALRRVFVEDDFGSWWSMGVWGRGWACRVH